MNEFYLIPRPVSVQRGTGVFNLDPDTRIVAAESLSPVAELMRAWLQSATSCSFPLSIYSGGMAEDRTIMLTTSGAGEFLAAEDELRRDGYVLDVTPDGICIRAFTLQGAFYAVQSLKQMLPFASPADGHSQEYACEVPCMRILDYPRFSWRGLHLDCARHMFPVEFVKRYIDLLAMLKMNVFHWHLTEDQGWRIEIKRYPELTRIGSRRSSSPVPGDPSQQDGKPYAGFYTQDEIRQVVAYAAERHVNVVPEIEMPGHSMAALASYPELGCTGGPYQVRTQWGIEEDVYCAGNEEVFEFLENVLDEVLDLFPSPFIHVGGDECPKSRWRECPKCQARIKEENLADEDELQSYFIRRIENYLSNRGRRLIGWDEILEGGLAPGATVMSWRGTEGGIRAAQSGHDVVMTPFTHCYFDYYQSEDHENEPAGIGGYLPLETVYAYEPVPEELTPEQGEHILGAQGNVWTEYIFSPAQVEYMAYPRAIALAEVVWTPAEGRDYPDFLRRLEPYLLRLDRMGVNYRKI